MPNTFNSSTLSGTYRDDWNDSDGYHQILFNSGRALQARELTQLQTIIQEEIARHGKNVFKEGSRVSAGGITIDNQIRYVKISTVGGGTFADIPVGTLLTGGTSGYTARVLDVKEAGVDGYTTDTLYLRYVGANTVSPAGSTALFVNTETLTGGGYTLTVENLSDSVGVGTKITVAEGDWFVLGHFVHSPEQTLYVSPYTQTARAEIVYEVVEDVITVNDTTALYDNTGGSANLASPGADRYRIRLILKDQTDVTAGATQCYVCSIENSTITKQATTLESYNKINELLALRTNEESGDYIVNPFSIHFRDDVIGDSNLDLVISPGIAYINGFRVSNSHPVKLSVPRSSQTQLVNNQAIPYTNGSFIISNVSRGAPFASTTLATVNIQDAIGYGGSTIGTCRVKAIDNTPDGRVRVYLFDVQMNAGQSFRTARSIGNSVTDYWDIDLETDAAVIKEAGRNDMFIVLPRPRPQNITDINITTQRQFTSAVASGNQVTITGLSANQTFVDTDRWIVAGADEQFKTTPTIISNTGTSVVIGGLTDGKVYQVYAYVNDTSGAARTKTLVSTTQTGTLATDPAGFKYFDIGFTDVKEVTRLRTTDSDGDDISSNFVLDNGQRDNYYGPARVILKNGIADPPGNIFIRVNYYSHSATGNFYDATSYPDNYEDIPSHRKSNGEVVPLRNVLDFRPDFNGTIFTEFGGDQKIELPRNGDFLSADVRYYTPRADKLLVTQEGDFKLLMGVQAENPQFKETPENSLELYKLILNGYTDGPLDLTATPIEHKRYTMKDINKLELQLNSFQEETRLSLLELEAKLDTMFDSAGIERIVAGLLVDDFDDQSQTDTAHVDHTASLDPESRAVRAGFDANNIRLIYDSGASAGIQPTSNTGDIVTLKFVDEEWQKQDLASRVQKVNPAGVVRNIGCLMLSPSSDEWKDQKAKTNYSVPGTTSIDTQQAYLWNEWQWNWGGRSAENFDTGLYCGRPSNFQYGAYGRKSLETVEKYNTQSGTNGSSRNSVSRVLSNDTIRETVGNVTVDIALVPWVRSRKVFFKAEGLKPNTKFLAFFDGVNVEDWVREEAAFTRWGQRTDELDAQIDASQYSQHPDGSTELTSDADGEVIGSFFIPNFRPSNSIVENASTASTETSGGLRFRTGVREFRLLDVTSTDITEAGSSASSYYAAKGVLETTTTNNIISTRLPWAAWTTPSISSFGVFPVFNQRALQTYLDAVNPGDVIIEEPHVSGSWTEGDPAVDPGDYAGDESKLLSDYISVDKSQYGNAASNASTPLLQYPLAQSFTVDNQFGLTLRQVKLFFASKDDTLPVHIQIRPMVNGAPSTIDIVPSSCAFKKSNEVAVTAYTEGSTLLTDVRAAATTFTFDEPVYLKPWTEYAIIVSSESPDYEVYTAKSLEYIIGAGGSQRITSQPAPGALFLPQNSTEWQPSKDMDLMYTLVRAKFDTNGSAVFSNASVPGKLLDPNPILLTALSADVYIKNGCHGLDSSAGDTVVISGLEGATSYGGITGAQINGTRTVKHYDIDGFVVTADASATTDGYVGGNSVVTSRNIQFNIVNPVVTSLVPSGTSIDVGAKFTTGRSVSGNETKYQKDATYARVTPGINTEFNAPRVIADEALETANLGGGVKSADVKINLLSSNDYVSPFIDLERISLVLVQNCIDDVTARPPVNERDETQPWMGVNNGGSRHVTTPISLADDAVGVKVDFDVNLPDPASTYDFYYRTAVSNDDILDKSWVRYPVNPEITGNKNSYVNQEILIGGQNGSLDPFNMFQSKIVFTSSNMAVSPSIRNLKTKFLAT
jgi:hypothetical protein